jgi:Rod binding domain-containing protein
MTDTIASAGSFYDFADLANLRARAAASPGGDKETRSRVAAEFESAFMQLMLQSMKEASQPLKSELFESQATDFVEDMFITEVSHFIAMRQSLGVGKWIDSTLEKSGVLPGNDVSNEQADSNDG